jgi:hypothetical protein
MSVTGSVRVVAIVATVLSMTVAESFAADPTTEALSAIAK